MEFKEGGFIYAPVRVNFFHVPCRQIVSRHIGGI